MTKEVRLEKVFAKCVPNGDCLEYPLGLSPQGYPMIYHNNRVWRGNRLVFHLLNGNIPQGLWVLHSCDNPKCINPKHLRLGTAQDNTDDMMKRGRHVTKSHPTHCPAGHLMAGDNLIIRFQDRKGDKHDRMCLACKRKVARDGWRRRNGKNKFYAKDELFDDQAIRTKAEVGQ